MEVNDASPAPGGDQVSLPPRLGEIQRRGPTLRSGEDVVQKRDVPWVSSVDQVPWDLRGREPAFYTWSLGSRDLGATEKADLFLQHFASPAHQKRLLKKVKRHLGLV